MKLKSVIVVMLALLLVNVIMLRYEIQPVEAGVSPYSPADAISLEPATATVSVNQTATVNMTITNVTDLYGYDFWLHYNSTIIEHVDITVDGPGQVAPTNPAQRVITDLSMLGTIKYSCVFLQAMGAVPFNGSGTLAWITFKGKMVGNSTLTFDQTWTKAYDHNGDDIYYSEFNDGSVTVVESIKIGVIGPMDFMQGQGMWEGATLAAEEINAAGGVNVSGVLRPIELHSGIEYIFPDDPAESATEMERLITDVGVDFVIGGYSSPNVLAMREVAMDHQKIFIITSAAGGTISGAHHDLVDCGDVHDPDGPLGPTPPGPCNACLRCNYTRYKNLFRVSPVNGSWIARSVYAFNQFILGQKLLPLYGELLWDGALNPQVKVAVITENFTTVDIYHLYSTHPAIYPSVLGPYANVTYVARPSINETDFSGHLAAIRDSGARLIIHFFASEAGLTFIKQWRDMNIEAIPVGINVLSQQSEMWNQTAGKCEYETILAPTGTRTPITNLSIPFWDAYVNKWEHDPIYTAFGAYGAIYTLKEAIERAGTLDNDDVIPELEQTDSIGTTGKFKFTGPNPGHNGDFSDYDPSTPGNQSYPYLAANPIMKGTLHNVFCNEIGPTWTQKYSRPFVVQWQASKKEVIWPADQPYSKEIALPPWMPEAGPIKVGVIGPMNFIQGQGMWEGATLAAEQINATGGVNVSGVLRPIELHPGMEYIYPDDPAESATEMERLITDVGVDFVVGGFRTENVFEMREVAMDHQKIFIITSAAANELVDCNNGYDPDGPWGPTPPGSCVNYTGGCVRHNYTRYKYIFRVAPANSSWIARSLWAFHRFVLEDKLLPVYGEILRPGAPNPQVKVAVVSENLPWADVFHWYMTTPVVYQNPQVLGPYANVTYSARLPWNGTDFSAYLTAIRNSGARLIIHVFSAEAGLTFIKQWNDMEIKAVPVGINVFSQTSEMWNLTSGKCENETMLAMTGTRTPLTNLSIPFWDAYFTRWGHDPIYPPSAFGTYNAIYTLNEAIERAGTTDADTVVAELEQTDRTDTTGKFKFTQYHNVFCNEMGPTWTQGYSRPLIAQWQAGRLEVIWPADKPYSKEFRVPTWTPSIHDVAITHARVSRNFACAGENVSICVDVWNRGTFPETFNVTVNSDQNLTIIGDEITIGTKSLSLPSRGFTTLTYTWNTTNVLPGNYTISAVACNVTQEADLTDNLYVNDKIGIFASIPCYDINITSPQYVELNPSIFQFNWTMRSLETSLGNMTIDSTGYEGLLRVIGSTNGTIHLRVDQPHLEIANYYLPQNGSIKVPLWLLFDPGTYSGTYELQLTVCGTHRLKITINIVHIWVCQNGVYSVAGGTATFNWTVTGGSWVYLEAQPNLPPGWSFTVDPQIGTLFETPHQIIVNITAAPDAKEGDTGSVTIRAYKNGTNILIWQYTFFASVDNKPPTIETIPQPTLTFTGDLLFNATVKDASGIESVQLYHSVNNGTWNNQTMQWNSGDTFNSTSYKLTIPHVPDDSTVKYYIVATDWLGNQTQSDTQTIIVKYDLAVTEVRTRKTVVGQGFATQINVTIANQGTLPNTLLKIVVYANTTFINTQTIPILANGTATTLTFYWNTTNVPKGNYNIKALVIPILDETDTADNTFEDGWVLVTVIGDVNGDRTVDGGDQISVGWNLWWSLPHPEYYNPNADVNGDDACDGGDQITVGNNLWESWP